MKLMTSKRLIFRDIRKKGTAPLSVFLTVQHKVHVLRVPQCPSSRPSWDPPPPLPKASVPHPVTKGGGDTRLRVRGWGGRGFQVGRLKKKPSTLSTLIKKIRKFFLIYKEIQKGAVAKSYRRKGFLIYEEMRKY